MPRCVPNAKALSRKIYKASRVDVDESGDAASRIKGQSQKADLGDAPRPVRSGFLHFGRRILDWLLIHVHLV